MISDRKPGQLRRKNLHKNWLFRCVGESAWRKATVPGCNHTDLLNSGAIEDPFYRANEASVQWIERKEWEYRCNFNLNVEDLNREIELVFEGLDTYATVTLNNVEILDADNMFRTYRVACKNQLLAGNNELVIVFRSPIIENLPKHRANGFTYPAENDKSEERLSVYARKAPYHFGWDWGPRFVTSGIWRDVYLELFDRIRIADVEITINEVTEAQASLTFDIQLAATQASSGHLQLHRQEQSESCATLSYEVVEGQSSHRVDVLIDHPQLWWPNGLGDAHLYNFHVLLFNGGRCVDKTTHKVGIRTIEVVNKDDEYGQSFFIKVNGRAVFMKGANYIPSDSFLDQVSNEKYRRVFFDAVSANMNMLRVWGGGVYESDTFYDLADEHGILIWQDFMFACSLYPADTEFLHSVQAEAVDNITRLRNHACLALWCGNNEVAMGIECWNWPEKFAYSKELYARLKDDYSKLFHELLPSLVERFDSERFYLPSSPIGFWERREEDGVGNSHFWGVWHDGQDFEEYRHRVSRFVTEYGFQSFPTLDSVRNFSNKEDWDINSLVMQTHQRHPNANQLILDYLRRNYPEPENFEYFLYLSQIQQADALRVAFEAHRTAMPFCMGSLYWQLNDCWPVASWSSIDYYGRWKALHYQVRRSFAPVIICASSSEGSLQVHVVSDLSQEQPARFSIELLGFAGDTLFSYSQSLTIAPNKSMVVYSVREDELLAGHDPRGVVAVMRLVNGEQQISYSYYYFVPTNQLALEKPEITVTRIMQTDAPTINLKSSSLAKNVYVCLTGASSPVNLSDNFFDLLPGEEKVLSLSEGGLLEEPNVKVMSVFDVQVQKQPVT